jgi:hypothetical protein
MEQYPNNVGLTIIGKAGVLQLISEFKLSYLLVGVRTCGTFDEEW